MVKWAGKFLSDECRPGIGLEKTGSDVRLASRLPLVASAMVVHNTLQKRINSLPYTLIGEPNAVSCNTS